MTAIIDIIRDKSEFHVHYDLGYNSSHGVGVDPGSDEEVRARV